MSYSGIQMIGTQRSGSNLLRLILNQAPEIVSVHPVHLLINFLPLMKYYEPMDETSYRRLVSDVVEYVSANPVKWETELDGEILFGMAREYSLFELNKNIYEYLAAQKEATIWCCKSMGNMYYSSRLEENIQDLKYIYLYRDGRDVALSFQKAIVGEKHIYQIAKQWHEDQRACLDLQNSTPGDRFFALRYESLIEDPTACIKELCRFLSIPFTESMLDYYASKDSKRTAEGGEMWANLTKPIMQDNSNKFLKEMSDQEILIFESVAYDSLLALNYKPVYAREDLLTFSPDRIEEFEKENNALKAVIKQKVSAEDIIKRQPQLDILKRIHSYEAVH
jgi:hypothetical protein